MDKKLKRYEIIGFVSLSVIGTILHFVYGLSGKSFIVGLFAPINESPWEHMKLLFVPFFVYAIIESQLLKSDYKNIYYSKLIAILFGMWSTLSLFYTVTGTFGKLIDWFNILTYFIGLGIAFVFSYVMIKTNHDNDRNNKISFIVMIIILLVFVILTITPPKIPLFQDPITKLYGI